MKDKSYSFLFEDAPPNEWIAIDCETTGLDVRRDEIISIAAIPIKDMKLLTSERLELLIKPKQELSAQSVRVHRLRACATLRAIKIFAVNGMEEAEKFGK